MPDHFVAITEERHRVADFLGGLTDEQWDTPSCCGAWTIAEVAAHTLVGPVLGLRGAMPYMFKARMNPAKAGFLTAQVMLDRFGRDGLVPAMREYADSRFTPPGFDSAAPLVDITLHGQDMSRPLGAELDVPIERWMPSLETAITSRYAIISARKHLKGLHFEATDLDFATGDGPAVSGAAKDLAHAMWGRLEAVDALDGDGVDTLRSRLSDS